VVTKPAKKKPARRKTRKVPALAKLIPAAEARRLTQAAVRRQDATGGTDGYQVTDARPK
jgi:hypothetical protein